MTREEQIEQAARQLLDAMRRQHGAMMFSLNVATALAALERLLPPERDESDRSRKIVEAA